MKQIQSRLTRQHFGNIRALLEQLQEGNRLLHVAPEKAQQLILDAGFMFSADYMQHISEACRDIANSSDYCREPIAVVVQ